MTPAIRATGRSRAVHGATFPCSLGGQASAGSCLHIGDAGQAASHRRRVRAQPLGIDPHPDPEHQLVALVLGLHGLGRELRLRGDERDLRRDRDDRVGVEHDARVGADLHLAGLVGRQIDVHVDVFDVEHGEDLAAGGQHLADIGDAVLDAARRAARRAYCRRC